MKLLLAFLSLSVIFICCKKKSPQDNNGYAKVIFKNNMSMPIRLILTNTTDTVAPYSNNVLDIDVPEKGTVTKTDIPTGKRKLIGFILCSAGQPVISIACTTFVKRNAEYQANQTYTELFP
jgi:hypothetical protein